MPSGYTEGVQSGKVTNFAEFALQCARAFGACVELRDDRLSSDIPTFKVSDYYQKSLDRAKEELRAWDAMSEKDQLALMRELSEKQVSESELHRKKRAIQRQRYEAMLAKAMEFVPPTDEHIGLKQFMIEQLQESIKFDCSTEYWDQQADKPLVPFEQWQKERTEWLVQDVQRSQKRLDEEVERVRKNNLWVRQLKESLGK